MQRAQSICFLCGFLAVGIAHSGGLATIRAGHWPLEFEPVSNETAGVLFRARHSVGDVLIARSGVEIRQSVSRRLKIQFEGAEPDGPIAGEGPVGGYRNYILGSDPARWRTRIPVWSKIRQTSIYPGIDLIYHARGSELEYDLIVAPGADPSRIRMRYSGVRKAHVDERGDLVLFGKFGVVRQHRPVAYQDIGGKRVAVYAVYHTHGCHATFLLGDYDKSHQLTIDPALTYATYLGGEFTDTGYAIAADFQGNAYVTGFTRSPGFPTSSRAFQSKCGTNSVCNISPTDIPNFIPSPTASPDALNDGDAFVAKISSDGSTLAWATFFGGNAGDVGGSIAVDPAGNVYVAGRTTSTDFPTTSHAFGNVKAPATFFAKFDNSGARLIFSSLAFGLGNVFVGGDAAGNAYLAGVADGSGSTPLPVTQGAIQTGASYLPSAYFCKLDPNGNTVLYGSYYGGNGPTTPSGLSVSAAGVVSIGGTTGAPDLPTSPGAFQQKPGGSTNAFVLKFDTTARHLIFSSYLGGSNAGAVGVASDSTGNVYLAGSASSLAFPIVGGMQLPANSPGFAAKLSPDGAHLVYSTRLAAAPLAMAGSADGTLTFFDSSYDGYFVHQLSPSGTSLTADFFLPGGSPYPPGMAVDGTHNVYLASWRSTVPGDVTNVPPFVGTSGSFQPFPAGEADATVVKVSPTAGTLQVIPPSLDLQTTSGQQIQADFTIVSMGRPNALPVRYSIEVDVPWMTLPIFETYPVAYPGPPTYHITTSVGSSLESPLATGTYSGRVIVKSPGTENSPVVVPVKLTVNAPNTSFPYAYPPFAHCTYRIGSDATDYNTNTLNPAIFISPQVLSANVVSSGWLKFGADSVVRCDPSNLAPGVYQGEVDAMAGTTAPGTLVKIYVDFTVSGTPVYANPGSVEFFALPGSAFAEATTVVTNQTAFLSPAALAYMNVTSTAHWLTATPTSGTLPDLLTIRVDPKGLSPGVYHGAIQLKVEDVSVPDLRIPVILNITPGVPFTASPATVAYQLPSLEMLSRNRTIFLNSASPVHFNVTTSRGMLDLRVTPTSGTAPATLNLTAAGARFDLSSPSDFIAISTTEGGGFTQIIPVKISSAAFMATFTSSGVVNGATFAAGPVAPGSIVSIFGSYLSLIKEQAPSLPLTTDLAGSTVYVGGLPAPEFYVSPTQINIQVPPQVQPGSERIQIVLPGHPSDGASIDVASSAPGIFMYGGNQAAAQNADYSLNGPKNAARPGSALIIYMTGQGALDHQIPTGAASPANPLAHPLLPVTAAIGGQPVDILFAGMAPGLVGVCQVNLRVPNVPAGQYPVAITVGGVESNAPLVSIGAQ